jgi:hypothetical protein
MKTTITVGDVAAELLRGQVDAEFLNLLRAKAWCFFSKVLFLSVVTLDK